MQCFENPTNYLLARNVYHHCDQGRNGNAVNYIEIMKTFPGLATRGPHTYPGPRPARHLAVHGAAPPKSVPLRETVALHSDYKVFNAK